MLNLSRQFLHPDTMARGRYADTVGICRGLTGKVFACA